MYFRDASIEPVAGAERLRRICDNCRNVTDQVLHDQPCGIGFGIPIFTRRPFWSSHYAYFLVCPTCSCLEQVTYDEAQGLIRQGQRSAAAAKRAMRPATVVTKPRASVPALEAPRPDKASSPATEEARSAPTAAPKPSVTSQPPEPSWAGFEFLVVGLLIGGVVGIVIGSALTQSDVAAQRNRADVLAESLVEEQQARQAAEQNLKELAASNQRRSLLQPPPKQPKKFTKVQQSDEPTVDVRETNRQAAPPSTPVRPASLDDKWDADVTRGILASQTEAANGKFEDAVRSLERLTGRLVVARTRLKPETFQLLIARLERARVSTVIDIARHAARSNPEDGKAILRLEQGVVNSQAATPRGLKDQLLREIDDALTAIAAEK